MPQELDFAKHVYHLYAIRVKGRESLIKAMTEKDIQWGIHYPIPIHLQDAYNFLDLKKGSFPNAEKCAEELLSLPMFPELTREQIAYVANGIKGF